ncbi:trafficking protein particle complex subunit 12 [Hermetia illucens]|uniref:trafficking protein particle complex subunit 12 n=1 Tax=Hermetia illucens TaxID=343691 RepID=UPI0018CC30DB|nr:trafficking protein particle complex subunit 12 [Hermetia illucens]
MDNSATSPSLSHYFANDPPSFFDEIPKSGATDPLTHNNFNGSFQAPDYFENPELEEDIRVSEDVRNFWLPPHTEPGIPPLLTLPGVLSPNDLSDPIRDAVALHLGEPELSQRHVLTVGDVTQDERGLRRLISAGCFRAAVNLTGRLLTIYGQGYGRAGQPAKHSPHSLQLWFTRLALLTKLGQYELLQSEAEPFGQLNSGDVYYDFYHEMYGGKKGSMACFSFRLLLAEIPMYTGSPKTAMDRLSELSALCNEIKNHFKSDQPSYEFWRKREVRVLHSIINCGILMRDYCLVDDIMKVLLAQPELSKEDKRFMFSAWGRIYLQIGDVFGAEHKFAEARRLKDMNATPDLRDLVDKGLIAVAQNDFFEAHNNFQKALNVDPTNTMLLNNMGVCLLYSGKLKDAIALFEKAINMNPQKSLNENLLINLSTLYELESSNSRNKKLNLLRLVNRFKPDLNISLDYCLKLQSNN